MRGSTITKLLLVLTWLFGGNSVHGVSNHESGVESRLSHDVLPQANLTLAAENPSAESMEEQFPSLIDPVWPVWFFLCQLFPAQVNDTFPTVGYPLRLTPASDGFYKLHPCKRTDLAKCLYHGTLPLKRILVARG